MTDQEPQSPVDFVQKLLCLAQQALDDGASTGERVERIVIYCELFARWQAQGLPRSGSERSGSERSGSDGSGSEEELLAALQHLHTQVLDTAKELAANTRGDLHTLKKRAKGLLRYADQLPRQISAWIQRKG